MINAEKDTPIIAGIIIMADGENTLNKIDYFRDTPIRLLGYANEVGEALRQLIHLRIVRLSYVIASTYCLADAASKANDVIQDSQHICSLKSRERIAAECFVEAAIWQGLASVIIPGFTINRICWLSGLVLRRTISSFSSHKQKLLVTAIGISSIPIIIKPIDQLTDKIMAKGINITENLGIRHEISHEENFSAVLDKDSTHQ